MFALFKNQKKTPPLFLLWNLIYWQLQKNYHSSGSWICQSKDMLNKQHIKLTTMSSPALYGGVMVTFLWSVRSEKKICLNYLYRATPINIWKLSGCMTAISPYHIRVLLYTWFTMYMYCLASIIKMRGSCTYYLKFARYNSHYWYVNKWHKGKWMWLRLITRDIFGGKNMLDRTLINRHL